MDSYSYNLTVKLEQDIKSNSYENQEYSLSQKVKLKNPTLVNAVEELIGNLTEDQQKNNQYGNDFYTPHGKEHCISVDKIVDELVTKSSIVLSNTEEVVLYLSVWLHDIGMYDKIAKESCENGRCNSTDPAFFDEKRKKHEEIAAWYLHSNRSDITKIYKVCGINENSFNNLVNTLCTIIKFHRSKYPMNTCPTERYLGNNVIRVDLLAALLRFADTLNIDSTRFESQRYRILRIVGNIDWDSRSHWIKSYIISSIFLDFEKKIIRIIMDLPNNKNITPEQTNKISSKIQKEIEDDLIEVNTVFFKHNIDFYQLVDIQCEYILGMDQNIEKDIESVLLDLDVSMSPNTSSTIDLTLETIDNMLKRCGDQNIINDVKDFIKYMQDMCKRNLCHVAVNNALTQINEVINLYSGDNQTTISYLKCKIRQIKKLRREAKKVIQNNADVLKGVEHFFLFGYSQMVIDLLAHYFKTRPNESADFYIFECASKTRYSRGNIEYHDGRHYALQLMKNGLNKVQIMPDITFATLANELIKQEKLTKNNGLLLFGSNGIGIYPTDAVAIIPDEKNYSTIKEIYKINNGKPWGKISHSAGHLGMCWIAQKMDIPIKVVADGFKFYRVEPEIDLAQKKAQETSGSNMEPAPEMSKCTPKEVTDKYECSATKQVNMPSNNSAIESNKKDPHSNPSWLPFQERAVNNDENLKFLNYKDEEIELVNDDINIITDIHIKNFSDLETSDKIESVLEIVKNMLQANVCIKDVQAYVNGISVPPMRYFAMINIIARINEMLNRNPGDTKDLIEYLNKKIQQIHDSKEIEDHGGK